jgi:hypothetical protein
MKKWILSTTLVLVIAAAAVGSLQPLSAAPELTDPNETAIFYVVDSPHAAKTRKITWANMVAALAGIYQAYNAGLSDIAGLSKEDGVFIVGNGSAWVAEGGGVARYSLGLGTSNNPQFTGVNVGHPSDTTVTRPSAGNLAVEGNLVYRAGGTDVPVADGGTGASTAANARTNLYIDQYLDVREYGASDQDSVDDTNEIAAAYAAAAAAGKGLLIPRTHSSGYYKLMATWAIGGGAEKRGIEIVGLGHPEIRWAGGTGGTMVEIDGSLAGRYVGIWLNGNDVAGVNGVLHTGSASPNQHNTFDHIWVQNCPGVGIDVNQTDSYTVDYTDLRQCVLQGNGVNLRVRGGSRQVTLSGGANLSANSYGIRIGNGAVADGGSVYCYDYFWGGNTTSDIYIDGSISSLKVYGGNTESDCFLTNSAYAEDGSAILGPIVLDGLTQDASPAGSAIVYTGWHSISFRDCKFGGDVDISDDCAGVWSINTEFSAGDFIGACTRFTRFLPQENIHVLGGYAFQSASDGKFNLLSGSTPVLVMQADGTADVQLFTANAGLHVKNGSTSSGFLALHNDSDDGEEYGALSSETLTANRAWTLPDANGVILLDSDIGTTVQAYNAGLSDIAGLSKTDGYFIVGNGSAWVAEGGGVARYSLGLGTSNNPQFAGVNVGHPSDTTVTRPSAGNLAVEGNLVYRAGGTDVPVADGGTGASTAAGARTNLGVGDANSPQFAGVRLGDYEILEDGGTLLIEDDGTPVFSVAGGYIDVATLTANAGLHVKNGSTSSGFLALHNDSDDGEEYGALSSETLTANRAWTLPDRSGKVMLEWPAVKKTSTGNLLASESHCHIHTDGAVNNIDLTLPTAVVGMKYRVVRSAAISLRLLPYTGQNFLGQSTSVAFSFDATGTSVTIECYATGVWTITAQFGSYSWEAY